MTDLPSLVEEHTPRDLIAAEVRAQLARRKGLNSNSLPNYLGKSQRYWNQRLNGKLAFDADDLARLSWLLQVPMSSFVPDVIADIDPSEPSGPAAVVGGGNHLYGVNALHGSWKLPHLDSNQEPAGPPAAQGRPHEPTPVVSLTDRISKTSIDRGQLAKVTAIR